VDQGRASHVSGALMPTQHPYLYGVTAGVSEGQTLSVVEDVVLAEIDRLQTGGITAGELAKALAQLKARFVYDGDSVTDIAHQLGYFETFASWQAYHDLRNRLDTVTADQVQQAAARYLVASNRTIGWFEPQVGA
ncbi:MAG: M16 family metallopeptidase, partial [Acidimicrobiia bacterium]